MTSPQGKILADDDPELDCWTGRWIVASGAWIGMADGWQMDHGIWSLDWTGRWTEMSSAWTKAMEVELGLLD
jgi:hypothetical protein